MLSFSGKVIKGDQYGRTLGFPTANIDRRDFTNKKLKVKLGIWSGSVTLSLNAKRFTLPAAIVIGPLDKTSLPKLEAHILDFKGNLYGKKMEFNLKKFIRPFKKYKSEQELIAGIKKDILKIRKIIKS